MTKGKMKNSGITLIALVLTIIVLLILAGVSIAMLSGDNSILQKATDAKTNTDNAQIKEKIQLAYHSALTGGQGSYTKESLEDELEKEFGENNYNVDDSDSSNWILTGKVKEKEQNVTIPAGKIIDTTWQKAFEFPEQHFNRYILDKDNKIIKLIEYGPQITVKELDIKSYAIIEGEKYTTKFPDSMRNIFASQSLEKVIIDSKVDMSNVTDMENLFTIAGCSTVRTVSISNSTTNNVTTMAHMFQGCINLCDLNLTNLNTSNVSDATWMFKDCKSLNSLDISNWNTNEMKKIGCMFDGCTGLSSLDLSNWNTDKVEEMNQMFDGCSNLTELNLSNWNTSNVTTMTYMFRNCGNLKKVIASDTFVTTKVSYSANVFGGNILLVGGNGTLFDDSKTDKTMAWIDGKDGKVGYFSTN